MAQLSDLTFSDIHLTPGGEAFIVDPASATDALTPLHVDAAEDLPHLLAAVEAEAQGRNSFAVAYGRHLYRVERVLTALGPHHALRRIERTVPTFAELGFPTQVAEYLMGLQNAQGLIMWAGSTGSGKTTAVSALLRAMLETTGGFAFTIEDPPELPLDGRYEAPDGHVGLCQQTEPPDGRWGDGVRAALRCRPRYILVGEIRTPEGAAQALRAASSGHLVFTTIHGSTVEDAILAMVKYAIAADLDSDLAFDLMARSILAVVHQKLVHGATGKRRPQIRYVFGSPDGSPDAVRSTIRGGRVELGTQMEQQNARLFQGRPLFERRA